MKTPLVLRLTAARYSGREHRVSRETYEEVANFRDPRIEGALNVERGKFSSSLHPRRTATPLLAAAAAGRPRGLPLGRAWSTSMTTHRVPARLPAMSRRRGPLPIADRYQDYCGPGAAGGLHLLRHADLLVRRLRSAQDVLRPPVLLHRGFGARFRGLCPGVRWASAWHCSCRRGEAIRSYARVVHEVQEYARYTPPTFSATFAGSETSAAISAGPPGPRCARADLGRTLFERVATDYRIDTDRPARPATLA